MGQSHEQHKHHIINAKAQNSTALFEQYSMIEIDAAKNETKNLAWNRVALLMKEKDFFLIAIIYLMKVEQRPSPAALESIEFIE